MACSFGSASASGHGYNGSATDIARGTTNGDRPTAQRDLRPQNLWERARSFPRVSRDRGVTFTRECAASQIWFQENRSL